MPELKIEKLGLLGDGIAQYDNGEVYIPFTIDGEFVKADINANRGILKEIITPSSARVVPECEFYGVCGGCNLQHIDDDYIAKFKAQAIETITQIKTDEFTNSFVSGRRRAKFACIRKGNDIILGFMGEKSHNIVAIDKCLVLSNDLNAFLPKLKELCRTVLKPDEKANINVTQCDNGIDVDINGLKPLNKHSRGELEAIAIAANKSGLIRLTFNGDLAFQTMTPIVKFANVPVEIPPNCFLQATHSAQTAMTEQLLIWAKGAKNIVDLFCGVGTFSLPLKTIGEVKAYEINASSVAALNKAAKTAAGGHMLEAFSRDLFRLPVSPIELKKIDLAVLDPARAGAKAQVEKLAKSKVKRVIYISCDPKSFAEDAKILKEGGFKIKSLKGFDQFRYSPHVELMGLFTR